MTDITNIKSDYIYEGGIDSVYVAETIADAINAEGSMRADAIDDRVYVSRQLSRGRQKMGFVEVGEECVNYHGLDRARSAIQSLAEKAICN